MFTVLGAIFAGGMLVETILYFAAPLAYSLAARVPLGSKIRVPLDRAARDALATVDDGPAGYRQSSAGRIDLGRLPLPSKLETSAFVFHFDPGRRLAVGRLPYRLGNRVLGMVRVDMREVDGGIELSARAIVFGWPSLVVVAPIALIVLFATAMPAQDRQRALFIGVVFVALNVLFGFVLSRPRLRDALQQIHGQIVQAIAAASMSRGP